ncbi:MAG: hypothetical protein AB1598_05060 [Thermodesulfobacteriota bacterium]
MRRVLIVPMIIMLWAAAAPAQTPDEAKAVKDINLRFQVLLYRLYELSNMNLPKGTNAANGMWRDKVAADPKLENLYKFPIQGLTGDAAKLAEVFGVFYAGTYKAFTDNPNMDAAWAGKGSIYRMALGEAGEKVYGISFNILQSGGGDETENKKFATEARNSARALIRSIDKLGPLKSGAFANKRIAVGAYNAANQALQKLDQLFAGDYSGPGGPGARVMRQVFAEITTIPTALEGPWLSPSWQLQFQYVCLTGSIVMEKVSPPGKN